jgi:hypothetical protein
MLLEYTIYPNRANNIKIALTEDGAAINHLAVNRLAVYVGSTLFDSQDSPGYFDLTQATHFIIKLPAADIEAGKYACTLVIYDSGDLVDGYVWPIKFVVNRAVEPY